MKVGARLGRAAAVSAAFAAMLYVAPFAVASDAGVDDAGHAPVAARALQTDLGSLIGSQGLDTSIAATDSVTTVSGRGAFADLRVTVNQTQNLVNQAVSVTWEGGTPTRRGPGRFAAQYVQIMQCWGDDDGTNPDNPGPPPEQCVFGAIGDQFGGPPFGLMSNAGAVSRIVSNQFWEDFSPDLGYYEEQTGFVWTPFRAVDGTVVDVSRNPDFVENTPGSLYWTNPYYDQSSTNEVIAGRTAPDGTGSEFFEVQTGVEAPWLGCGQRAQEVAPGQFDEPKCWIVVVPRGEPRDENFGRSLGDSADRAGIVSSPFSPTSWPNRIAVPIEFNPIELPCDFADARRIGGAETAQNAVTNWQPTLCGDLGLPPFNYTAIGEPNARRQQAANAAGAPSMIGVLQPQPPDTVADEDAIDEDPEVYAPLTLSGITIGFNYQRAVDPTSSVAEQAAATDGVRVADFNLTPRLVAKLLTQSYLDQISVGNRRPGGEAYEWLANNPRNLVEDPDFVQFNPEFQLLDAGNRRNMSGLVVLQTSSDVATAVWEWILEDDEAAAWMRGEPDEFGAVVNPWFSTKPELQPNGIAFAADGPPNNFPKPDPYCFTPDNTGPPFNIQADDLCGINWNPYVSGLRESAVRTSRADDGARIIANTLAPRVIDYWNRTPRQSPGDQAMIALTDTSSAALFGLQPAGLSRADDNRATRNFVAPDTAGLTRGVDAMSVRDVPGVLLPDHTIDVEGAYPLSVITYASTNPMRLDADERDDYASFVEYAAGDGQTPGFDPGDLPPGYAPLPDDLRAASRETANLIRTLDVESPAPTTTAPPTTSVTTTTVPSSTDSTTTVAPVTNNTTSPTVRPTVTVRPTTSSGGSTGGGSTPNSATTTTTTTIVDDEAADDEAADDGAPAEDSADSPPDVASTTAVPVAEETEPPPTPAVGVATASRLALPGIGGVAMFAALVALEISKRPRRSLGSPS